MRAPFSGNAEGTTWRGARAESLAVGGANMAGADFTRADLRGLMAVGANFDGATFKSANLDGARGHVLAHMVSSL